MMAFDQAFDRASCPVRLLMSLAGQLNSGFGSFYYARGIYFGSKGKYVEVIIIHRFIRFHNNQGQDDRYI